jgi:hypothetical protein
MNNYPPRHGANPIVPVRVIAVATPIKRSALKARYFYFFIFFYFEIFPLTN